MNNKEIKMQLLKEFGCVSDSKSVEFCRKAYEFITEEGRSAANDGTLPNGVYVVYENGDFAPYGEDTSLDNVSFIGISWDGHTFGVGRYIGEYPLLSPGDLETDDLCVPEYKALADWDFVTNTEHIWSLRSPIPLNDGEYLPTAPVFVAMANLAEHGLNKALTAIGEEEIDLNECYWLAERYSAHVAWYFFGTYGVLYSGHVSVRNRTQAVTLWNPE